MSNLRLRQLILPGLFLAVLTISGLSRVSGPSILYSAANPVTLPDTTISVSPVGSSDERAARNLGEPILVISSSTNPFTAYYGEILRTEGFNSFAMIDISSVTATTLSKYDVAILGEIPLTDRQVSVISNWVKGGGNLIAMRPDKKLASLLGLISGPSTLSNGYLLVNASSGPGLGIVNETIQFHGAADLYALDSAFEIAVLYSNASTSLKKPAITLKPVGSNGGHAAAFTYDLAKSIVYTRQGNPAWSGQERDGLSPIRSNDLYFGAKQGDLQPDWVDLNKVTIPQADEQQRLLANLIVQMNINRKPLPRFWYLPRSLPAVVIMTGDDHGKGGTAARFDSHMAKSPAGCSLTNWECIRSTSYMYTGSVTRAQALAYDALGFEVALHVNTNCDDWTPTSLETFYASQMNQFKTYYHGMIAPASNRTHCIVWSDYATQPQVEFKYGVRLDTSYYFWPSAWILDRPGFVTGSGMPMRFAKADGTLIDVYQVVTQMTDESGQTYPHTIDKLLDSAIGPQGFYGVFAANMHLDSTVSSSSDTIIAAARARQIPVISARQMLQWLDGRNESGYTSLAWNGSTLNFSISAGKNATGLVVMIPIPAGLAVSSVTRDGVPVDHSTDTVKGIPYALVYAGSGSYGVTFVPLRAQTGESSA